MSKTIAHNQVLHDDFSSDEMPLNDLLEYWRIARAIPSSLRIDHGNRTATTDAQAIGLRPQNPALLAQA